MAIFLKFVIREIVSQETTKATQYSKEQLYWEDDSGEERELSVENSEGGDAHHLSNPEELIIEYEELERLSAKLEEIYNDDDELELVILCILDNKIKSKEIAEETELPIKKVYNLKRKLKRRLACYYEDNFLGKE